MGTADGLDRETHRRLGVDLYNRAAALMEKEARTPEEDDELLHCAHASAHHWLHGGGTDANRARSQWQCSRVHALLGQAEGAVFHAERCLAIVQASPAAMADFDLPAAYEALARGHAVAGNAEQAREYVELGRAEAAKIADEDDRALIESDLAAIDV